jgi:hypothetical protein
MTPRTPQCEVFWSSKSSSELLGVPEDSNPNFFQVLGFTPTLGQSRVATQTTLRADQYKGMVDAMQQDRANNTNFGRMVVLPASFAGSPRHMNQLYQDSMAFVRKFGKLDLFITVTCNPNWPEILHELRRGEETNDHLDLTSRVFNMKLNALLKDLLQNGILGTTVADIHVVEWQKRGLLHGHILIILRSQDQPRDNSEYDRIVCAELLEKSTHFELYNIVTSRMLHGLVGLYIPHVLTW